MQSGQTLSFAGNLLPSQSSNGRRLTSSTSLGERAFAGQGLHTEGSSCALGSLTSPSSGVDSAQELSEKVWGLLVEGLQPFMQWELQSGMGDFWEQVASLHVTSAGALFCRRSLCVHILSMCCLQLSVCQ